jgi:hypothetical protein
MKILVTLPHFFRQEAQAKHGSQKNPQARLKALTNSILSLQQLFGPRQLMIKVGERIAIEANKSQENLLDLIICTTGDNHLIKQLKLPEHFYQHYQTVAEPMLLGFECHQVLEKNLGKYDYYCYLEDDLMIRDANFFTKLDWFNQLTNTVQLLQPNRYELTLNPYTEKCYIDGDLAFRVTEPFQNIRDNWELIGKVMNQSVIFRRALNPHSGCFFLTNEQLEYWSKQEYFLSKATNFIGPLESAATLGIMRTFQIYKTTPEYANFLEIQHWGSAFANLLGSVVKVE